MATMLNGAAVMDAALLLIGAINRHLFLLLNLSVIDQRPVVQGVSKKW